MKLKSKLLFISAHHSVCWVDTFNTTKIKIVVEQRVYFIKCLGKFPIFILCINLQVPAFYVMFKLLQIVKNEGFLLQIKIT